MPWGPRGGSWDTETTFDKTTEFYIDLDFSYKSLLLGAETLSHSRCPYTG